MQKWGIKLLIDVRMTWSCDLGSLSCLRSVMYLKDAIIISKASQE